MKTMIDKKLKKGYRNFEEDELTEKQKFLLKSMSMISEGP